ncbi:MAG: hypothetical protein MRY21_04495 [Simkaniaceae bacterium]|nr:hypothetical protein [Simkaniaceae bacterium]
MDTVELKFTLGPEDLANREVKTFLKSLKPQSDLALAATNLYEMTQEKCLRPNEAIYHQAVSKLRVMGLAHLTPEETKHFAIRMLNGLTYGHCHKLTPACVELNDSAIDRMFDLVYLKQALSFENMLFFKCRQIVDAVKELHRMLTNPPVGIYTNIDLSKSDESLIMGGESRRLILLASPPTPETKGVLLRFGLFYERLCSGLSADEIDQPGIYQMMEDACNLLKQRSLPPRVRLTLRAMVYHCRYIIHLMYLFNLVDELNVSMAVIDADFKPEQFAYSPFIADLKTLLPLEMLGDLSAFKKATVNLAFADKLQKFLEEHLPQLAPRSAIVNAKVALIAAKFLKKGTDLGIFTEERNETVTKCLRGYRFLISGEESQIKFTRFEEYAPPCGDTKIAKITRVVMSLIEQFTANPRFKTEEGRLTRSLRDSFDFLKKPEASTGAGAAAEKEEEPKVSAGAGAAAVAEKQDPKASAGAGAAEEEESIEQKPYIEVKEFDALWRENCVEGRAKAETFTISSVQLWQTDPDEALCTWRSSNPGHPATDAWLVAIHHFFPDHIAIAKLTSTQYALKWKVQDPSPGCEYFAIPATKELPGRGLCDGFIQVIMRGNNLFHLVFQPENEKSTLSNTLVSRMAFQSADFPPLSGSGEVLPISGAKTGVEVDLIGTLHFESGLTIYLPPSELTEITS